MYLLLHCFIIEDETLAQGPDLAKTSVMRMWKELFKQVKLLYSRATVLGPKCPERSLKKHTKNIFLPEDCKEVFYIGKQLVWKGHAASQLSFRHSF